MSIASAFNLPPEQALKFFADKGLKPTFAWQDMLRDEHSHNFTVAKMLDAALLADVQDAVEQAMHLGWTKKQFADHITPLLIEKGWWGKQEMTDPATGETVLAQLGSPRRLRTIFDTNLSTAYAAGHWAAIVENADHRPWLRYIAVDDSRTRPQHAAWRGVILRWDHPWWKTNYPPNGWGCRCTVIAQTDRDLTRLGLKPSASAPESKTREWTNPRTGETSQVPIGIDPGWDYNVGADRQQRLARAMVEQAAVAPAKLGAALYGQTALPMLQALEADFAAWVDTAVASGHGAGMVTAVGVLGEADIAYLATQGITPENAGVMLEARLMVGTKAKRHADAGNALSIDDWKALPAALTVPEQVLWDTRDPALVYIFPAEGNQVGKIVVYVNYNMKKRGIVNVVRSVFKISPESVARGIAGGDYVLVR